MKRNIKTIAVLFIALVATVFYAHADIKPYKELDSKEVIMNYAGVSLLGHSDYTKYMFADDFTYSNTANNDVHGKKEYLKFLKDVKSLKLDCTQQLEVLDQMGNTAIGKVTTDFGHFSRVDYITLIQSEQGWKISKVVTTYP